MTQRQKLAAVLTAAGFTSASVDAALAASDLTLLVHSGRVSVRLGKA